jgi:hypothetical protein
VLKAKSSDVAAICSGFKAFCFDTGANYANVRAMHKKILPMGQDAVMNNGFLSLGSTGIGIVSFAPAGKPGR